jgi:hypothetical protein
MDGRGGGWTCSGLLLNSSTRPSLPVSQSSLSLAIVFPPTPWRCVPIASSSAQSGKSERCSSAAHTCTVVHGRGQQQEWAERDSKLGRRWRQMRQHRTLVHATPHSISHATHDLPLGCLTCL